MSDSSAHRAPRKASIGRIAVCGLLLGIAGWAGHASLAADADADAGRTQASPFAGGKDEVLFRSYVQWLSQAHAEAARHGDGSLLPEQF